MAYAKMNDMLGLALDLQASSLGLTIDQLMERTGRSRKTVERMLDGLIDLGLEAEPSRLDSDHHLTKRWRLRTDLPGLLLSLEPQERGALERHLQTLTDSTASRALAKLLAGQKPLSNHLAIDQEELIARTAHIGRTGPRTQANETHMAIFEHAIQGFETAGNPIPDTGPAAGELAVCRSAGIAVRTVRLSRCGAAWISGNLPARPDRGCTPDGTDFRGL